MDLGVTAAMAANTGRLEREGSRLLSLDVFRGVVIAGMILVTDPGTYSAVYWPLRHAEWNGATPTDMIFPSFLVMVGMAMTLSFASRIARGGSRSRMFRHVLRRSAVLFVLGLLVNGFPDYDLHTLRIPGILQRIAVCYLLGGSLYLLVSEVGVGQGRRVVRAAAVGGVLVALLAGYWALLRWYPVPGFGAGRLDSLGNVAAYLDRWVFGVRHMWAYGLTPGYGVTFDPEGMLSTLTALATLLMGVLAGEWMGTDRTRERKALVLVGAGAALAAIGYGLQPWLPLNKKMLTSTFAMFSGGVALMAFSLLYWVLDIRRWRGWEGPAMVLGTNAIFAFALSTVVTTMSDRIHVGGGDAGLTLHRWVYQVGFLPWLAPVRASLAYAIAIVVLNVALVYPLYRRRVFLRV